MYTETDATSTYDSVFQVDLPWISSDGKIFILELVFRNFVDQTATDVLIYVGILGLYHL